MLSAATYLKLDGAMQRHRREVPEARGLLLMLVAKVGNLATAFIQGNVQMAKKDALEVAALACRIVEDSDSLPYHAQSTPGVVQLVAKVGNVAQALLQRDKAALGRTSYVVEDVILAVERHGDALFAETCGRGGKAT
jgi:hypothetical protein